MNGATRKWLIIITFTTYLLVHNDIGNFSRLHIFAKNAIARGITSKKGFEYMNRHAMDPVSDVVGKSSSLFSFSGKDVAIVGDYVTVEVEALVGELVSSSKQTLPVFETL